MTIAREGVNPYDYMHPVIERRLFAGRADELATIEEEALRLCSDAPIAPLVAVIGERRVGKTSILRQAAEALASHNLLPVIISLTDPIAASPWEFWREVFDGIVRAASNAGIIEFPTELPTLGFKTKPDSVKSGRGLEYVERLQFFRLFSAGTRVLPPRVIQDDLEVLCECIAEGGFSGIILMIDEAHLMVESREISQQIRYAVSEAAKCGIVFAGEPILSQMFNDASQPLYAQARIIQLGNFREMSDIIECAILPLSEDERPLINPMSMEYFARMSQGKPNQIRLICNSIYRRFQSGKQDDLNITIEALDDVLENIAKARVSDYDLASQVRAIQRLGSVDLEVLYNMTRFPDWHKDDMVEFDESFRGESRSALAKSRRERILENKRQMFIRLGLLRDEPDRCQLQGDEFLHLYLRFWYEVNKYGQLSRALVLGKGPSTPFLEKVEKLIKFLTWEVSRSPDIINMSYFNRDAGKAERIPEIRRRFTALDRALADGAGRVENAADFVGEWFRTCQLVKTSRNYFLVAFSLRNLENPRESCQVEIYFKEETLVVPIGEIELQAESAKILVEENDYWRVYIPSLPDLLEATNFPSLDELLKDSSPIERWRVESVRRHVGSTPDVDESTTNEPDDESAHWIDLYGRGDSEGALAAIGVEMARSLPRHDTARLHNDIGYIKHGMGRSEDARKDLQRALDLHPENLQITLINLAVSSIDLGEHKMAVEYIENALYLTFDRKYIPASYLRLRIPGSHLPIATQEQWEQHPANLIEAGYINLAYALLQSGDARGSIDTLHEGLELFPSSVWLRYAQARLHLHEKRADRADPIYRQLSTEAVPNEKLAAEIRLYVKTYGRARSAKSGQRLRR